MLHNNIKKYRSELKMSQTELAAKAQTSQQQVQRIEAGAQVTRFDLATRLCKALGQPLQAVFPTPGDRKFGRGRTSVEQKAKPSNNPALDMDPRVWTFSFRLRGGTSDELPISAHDKSSLWSLVQSRDNVFVVFHSGDRCYAINKKHLMFCRFMFDLPDEPEEDDVEPEGYDICFHLIDSPVPMVFEISPDTVSIAEDFDGPDEATQIQDLFMFAECGTEQRLSFTDVEGETAFFLPDDVAMFSAPLITIEPTLWRQAGAG